jgi:hypothetical protein
MPKDDDCSLDSDRLILGPDLGDGSRPCIRHLPDHSIQTGVARLMKEGQPINGYDEILTICYDQQHGDFEVKSAYTPPTAAHKGPAMVTSNEYRTGYERIFGFKQVVGEA